MLIIFILAAALLITEYSNAKPLTQEESSLTPYLNKKYVLTSSDENFDEILKLLDVSFLNRQVAKIATPVMQLTEENGLYTLSSESFFKDIYVKFRMNEWFDEVTPDDRVARAVFTQEKNKLIQREKWEGGKETKITREFTPEKVTVTVELDGVVSTRVYSAVKDDLL